MIPIYRKFNYDIRIRFSDLKIFLLPSSRNIGTLWRHRWRHHHENTFLGIIWDDPFVSEVKLKLCLILENARHFLGRDKLFTGSNTRYWINQQNSHEHFRYFELLIHALVEILMENSNFKIRHTLWPADVIDEVMSAWYITYTNRFHQLCTCKIAYVAPVFHS